MKNGDKPASPIRGATNAIFTEHDAGAIDGLGLLVGLTKREVFAMTAMQGLLSAEISGLSVPNVASSSVMFADALLKELEKGE